MTKIHYVEIENFKTFKKKIHIDLYHPAVLIGPNNSGKTSVIQAISLWNRGVKSWFEKRGGPQKKESHGRIATPINRLNILEVPVAETRFLWNGTHVQEPHGRIELAINVGIEYKGDIKDCRIIFTYRDLEIIYCRPDPETIKDLEFLQFVSNIQFHLLYPMSGIMSNVSADTEETPLPDGRISLLLGQGQTAQVLRNICYKVVEQDKECGTNDWDKITERMSQIFLVSLNKPEFIESRGSLILTYRQQGMRTDLDISLAGRGLQQILLILAYIYWHKSSVLLIDEPDAHLEILRQKQIYAILNITIRENGGQVIIATHSEAILDDAVDTNLTLLLQGEAVNLAKQQEIKNSLRTYGIEHYYKAKVHPRILYLEGSTDKEILTSLAVHIGHEKAANVLKDKLNIYYIQNIKPENTLDNKLDRIGGSFGNYLAHFNTLKNFVPELKGFGIFDSDNIQKQDKIEDSLAIMYWKEYEIENYFITPEVLMKFAENQFNEDLGTLFQGINLKNFEETINEVLLETVFNSDKEQLREYQKSSAGLRKTLLRTIKMSQFAETVFENYAKKYSQLPLLSKGEFYRLIPFCSLEDISHEVYEKMDILVKYLGYSNN
jgi:ABC-type lipoprotein export system ATPase subunit